MGTDTKDIEYTKGAEYGDVIEPALVRDWTAVEEKKAKRKWVQTVPAYGIPGLTAIFIGLI